MILPLQSPLDPVIHTLPSESLSSRLPMFVYTDRAKLTTTPNIWLRLPKPSYAFLLWSLTVNLVGDPSLNQPNPKFDLSCNTYTVIDRNSVVGHYIPRYVTWIVLYVSFDPHVDKEIVVAILRWG